MVRQDIGDQPSDVIRSCAEEILTILKNEKVRLEKGDLLAMFLFVYLVLPL